MEIKMLGFPKQAFPKERLSQEGEKALDKQMQDLMQYLYTTKASTLREPVMDGKNILDVSLNDQM